MCSVIAQRFRIRRWINVRRKLTFLNIYYLLKSSILIYNKRTVVYKYAKHVLFSILFNSQRRLNIFCRKRKLYSVRQWRNTGKGEVVTPQKKKKGQTPLEFCDHQHATNQ